MTELETAQSIAEKMSSNLTMRDLLFMAGTVHNSEDGRNKSLLSFLGYMAEQLGCDLDKEHSK